MTNYRIPPDYLKKLNFHPRDEFIEFDEGPHIYTVHGKQGYTSVTTWNHSHFSHFDADKILSNMVKKGTLNDPTSKYYGMTPDEIKLLWKQNGAEASGSGTKMHGDIEDYYNQVDVANDSIEFEYFLRFAQDYQHLKPYRTEWTVYYEEYKLSGSIDMVFENPEDGTLLIYDWKRVKEFKYEPEYNKFSHTPCIKHLPDTNFWHYSLQLNTYKTILEAKYGKTISGMFLVCLHPDNPTKSYERVEVPNLKVEMENLFAHRKKEIEEKI
jgi:ATP-dependent exoDNAse (exonuclease V) beta subunit